MKNRLILAALLVTLIAGNALFAEDIFKVKVKYWNSGLSGEVQSDSALIAGTDLDLTKDLNLDENAYVPSIELKLKLGSNKIIASYWKSTYEGKQTLATAINYGGTTYNVNDTIESELNLQSTSIIYERVLVPEFITKAFPSLGEVELGLLIGIENLSFESSVASTLASEKEDGSAPIPVIGALFQVGILNKVKVELGALGFSATVSGIKAEYTDIYAEVDTTFIPYVPLGVGYKKNTLSLKDSDSFDTNIDLSGLYFFTSWEF
ncbi:MAG: hypothetical protein HY811_08565 [Planctomycetes bacterium]|nr:hypothetical protein [Planctomycetota bacterium]